MDQLYLCRHGETEWTLAGKHTGKTDISLTKRGKEEAKLLQKRLAKVPFSAAFTSPKKRALETAEGIRPKAIIEAKISEWDYGDYEGLTTAEIHQIRPSWNLFQDGAPNGETAEDVGKRADAFIHQIKGYQGNVAVFSHGHFLRVLAARFLGLDPKVGKVLFLSVASLCILGYDRSTPTLMLWNETDYFS